MSGINPRAVGETPTTHGGALATPHLKPIQELRRTVLSCMLWEDQHYESGESIAQRIKTLVPTCQPAEVAALAIEAREQQHLRHVPLLLVRELCRTVKGRIVGDTLARVIQRPDELTEFLAIYWKDGKCPLAKQVKLGLARAFRKFDEYQFSKHEHSDNVIKLRDVLFLVHAKPKSESGRYQTKHQRSHLREDGDLPMPTAEEQLYRRIVDRTLKTAETWESKAGSMDKDENKEAFEDLIRNGKLGYMALLRNLRRMKELGVDNDLIVGAIEARRGASKVLPFRFISAAREVPAFEGALDKAFVAGLQEAPKLKGRTLIVLDVSGSMGAPLSTFMRNGLRQASSITRCDAGAALCAILREQCEDVVVFATAGSDHSRIHATAQVPARHGMSLVDTFQQAYRELGGGGIFLKPCLDFIQEREKYDRVVVVTDEQDCTVDRAQSPSLARPGCELAYMVNVASYKNGIGYGQWTHIDGFSEATIDFIRAVEAQNG